MNQHDLQRWSREVAEDPGAPSFVRLARAYRRQGQRAAARDVVLRGLRQNPHHVGAHGLLALIYVEDGDRERAGDEWETVLQLDPGNFDASRGLGFLALERGDLGAARRHLEAATAARPDDPAVSQALQLVARREAAQPSNPLRVFDPLRQDDPFLGAVILDGQGLVLAGAIDPAAADSELLGALLSPAILEARRTSDLVGVGEWQGLMLECERALLHVAPVSRSAVMVLAAKPDAPAGWAARAAERARALAANFVEEGR